MKVFGLDYVDFDNEDEEVVFRFKVNHNGEGFWAAIRKDQLDDYNSPDGSYLAVCLNNTLCGLYIGEIILVKSQGDSRPIVDFDTMQEYARVEGRKYSAIEAKRVIDSMIEKGVEIGKNVYTIVTSMLGEYRKDEMKFKDEAFGFYFTDFETPTRFAVTGPGEMVIFSDKDIRYVPFVGICDGQLVLVTDEKTDELVPYTGQPLKFKFDDEYSGIWAKEFLDGNPKITKEFYAKITKRCPNYRLNEMKFKEQ